MSTSQKPHPQKPHPHHRARRAARGFLYVLLGLLGLSIIVIGGAIGFLHTSYGEAQVRKLVLQRLNETFYGPVTLRHAHLDVIGILSPSAELTAETLSIADAIDISTVQVTCGIFPLIQGEVRCDRIVMDGLSVWDRELAGGQRNLQNLLRPSEGESNVEIGELLVRNGSYQRFSGTGQAEEEVLHVRGIEALAFLSIIGEDIEANLKGANGYWEQGERPFHISAHVLKLGNSLSGTKAVIESKGSSLLIDVPESDLANNHFEFLIRAHVEPDVAAGTPWIAPVSANLSVGIAGDRGEIAIAGDAEVAEALIGLELHGVKEPFQLGGTFTISGANPAAIVRDAPPGDIHIELSTIEIAGDLNRLDTLKATLEGSANGQLGDTSVKSLALSASANKGQLRLRLQGNAGIGEVELAVDAHVPDGKKVELPPKDPDALAKSVWIDRAHVNVALSQLGNLAPELRSGPVSVSASVSGPLTGLAVDLNAAVQRLRSGPALEVKNAQLTFQTTGLSVLETPGNVRGTFKARADGIRSDAATVRRIDAVGQLTQEGPAVAVTTQLHAGHIAMPERNLTGEMRARVQASVRPGNVMIQPRDIHLRLGSLVWTDAGPQTFIHVGRRIGFRDVALASAAGRISGSGWLDGNAGELKLAVENLDLGKLQPITGVPLTGQVSVGVDALRRRGKWTGSVQATLSRILYPDLPAFAGEARIDLNGRDLRATGRIGHTEGDLTAALALTAQAPRDVLNGAAWSGFGLDNIQSAELTIDGNASAIQRYVKDSSMRASGDIKARLAFPHDGKRQLGITASVANAQIHSAKAKSVQLSSLSAAIEGVWSNANLSLRTQLIEESKDATFTTEVTAGVGLAQMLAGRPSKIPVQVDGTIDRFHLESLASLGVTASGEPLRGELRGEFAADATILPEGVTLRRAVLRDVRGSGIEIARLVVPEVVLNASTDGNDIAARLQATLAGNGFVYLRGSYDIRSRQVAAVLQTRALDLAGLRVISNDPTSPLGSIGGILTIPSLAISGPLGDLRGSGSLSLRNGEIVLQGGARYLKQISADIHLQPNRLRIAKLIAQSDEGQLDAHGFLELDGLRPLGAELSAKVRAMPFALGAYMAEVDGAVTLRGDMRGKEWEVKAEINEGEVRLDPVEHELQEIDVLTDVVYVDEQARREAEEAAQSRARLQAILQSETATVVHLRVEIEPGVRIRSPELTTTISGNVTAKLQNGVLGNVVGRLRANGGLVTLLDQKYEIAYARLILDGPVPPDPRLNIRLTHDFELATVWINVTGRVSDPRIELSSDSGYSEMQILSLMAGDDPESTSFGDRSSTEVVGGFARSLLAREVRNVLSLPIDVLRLHTDGYEVAKWLKLPVDRLPLIGDVLPRRILVGYRYRDSDEHSENTNEGTLRVPLRGSMQMEGSFGDRGVGDLDLLWILRF